MKAAALAGLALALIAAWGALMLVARRRPGARWLAFFRPRRPVDRPSLRLREPSRTSDLLTGLVLLALSIAIVPAHFLLSAIVAHDPLAPDRLWIPVLAAVVFFGLGVMAVRAAREK